MGYVDCGWKRVRMGDGIVRRATHRIGKMMYLGMGVEYE